MKPTIKVIFGTSLASQILTHAQCAAVYETSRSPKTNLAIRLHPPPSRKNEGDCSVSVTLILSFAVCGSSYSTS